jgi:lipopolysaccharide transport system permease protein
VDTRQGSRGVLSSNRDDVRYAVSPSSSVERLNAPVQTAEDVERDAAAAEPWVENRAPSGFVELPSARELWRFRELGLVLAGRELKVRYKQTLLGVTWVVVQPLVAAAIFTIVFGRLAGLPSEGLPYAIFAFSGLVLWSFFSGSLTAVAQSLVQNRELVTKTYFPAIVMPVAMALPALVDLGVALLVLAVGMALYGVAPGAAVVLLPAWIGLAFAVVLGAGLALAALNVKYRDVRHTLGFILQIWLFASPVVYAGSLVEGGWQYLYAVNPMVTALEGFRWSAVGGPAPGAEAFVSLGVTCVLLLGGCLYFLRTEGRFADLI